MGGRRPCQASSAATPSPTVSVGQSMEAAHRDHQQWLRNIHAAHARLSLSAAISVGDTASHELASGSGAPMAWQQRHALEVPLSGMPLDDDRACRVYRNINGDAIATGEWATNDDSLEDDFEQPVYRSLSAAPFATGQVDSEAVDRLWLQTMPPLIRRQRAGPLI